MATKMRMGGKHECFQKKCSYCLKTSRVASSWGTHVRASWPITKRPRALDALKALKGLLQPDYVAICGKKPVEMAQILYGGPKPLSRRWEWVK